MAPRPSRRELVDRLVSGSAGLLAVCALAVSAYQAYLAREQQRMSAWPYLLLPSSTEHGTQLLVQNVGLGPALVRTVEVTVDGSPVRRWSEAFRQIRGDPVGADTTVTSDIVPGTVVLPGTTIEMLRVVGPPELAAQVRDASDRDRIVRRVCFCSLYRDCWVADSRRAEPAAVRACAPDRARAFGR